MHLLSPKKRSLGKIRDSADMRWDILKKENNDNIKTEIVCYFFMEMSVPECAKKGNFFARIFDLTL